MQIIGLTATDAAYIAATVAPVARTTRQGDGIVRLSEVGVDHLRALGDGTDGHVDTDGHVWIDGAIAGTVVA